MPRNKDYSIIPTLTAEYAAQKIFTSLIERKKEVYIWWYIPYMRIVVDLLPLGLRNWVIQTFMGEGMRTFVGRQTPSMSMSESEKVD
jgi:hypothetical protein